MKGFPRREGASRTPFTSLIPGSWQHGYICNREVSHRQTQCSSPGGGRPARRRSVLLLYLNYHSPAIEAKVSRAGACVPALQPRLGMLAASQADLGDPATV